MALKGPVKLVYFDLRALGELPRLILHAAGESFDDCPGGIQKSEYEARTFGQAPLRIDGDRKIVQSRLNLIETERNITEATNLRCN